MSIIIVIYRKYAVCLSQMSHGMGQAWDTLKFCNHCEKWPLSYCPIIYKKNIYIKNIRRGYVTCFLKFFYMFFPGRWDSGTKGTFLNYII